MGTAMMGQDYAHWHSFFETAQDLGKLTKIYKELMKKQEWHSCFNLGKSSSTTLINNKPDRAHALPGFFKANPCCVAITINICYWYKHLLGQFAKNLWDA